MRKRTSQPQLSQKSAVPSDPDSLVGQTVVKIRAMTSKEMTALGLYAPPPFGSTPIVLEFDKGSMLYALSDEEGNGLGVLVQKHGGQEFLLLAVSQDVKQKTSV